MPTTEQAHSSCHAVNDNCFQDLRGRKMHMQIARYCIMAIINQRFVISQSHCLSGEITSTRYQNSLINCEYGPQSLLRNAPCCIVSSLPVHFSLVFQLLVFGFLKSHMYHASSVSSHNAKHRRQSLTTGLFYAPAVPSSPPPSASEECVLRFFRHLYAILQGHQILLCLSSLCVHF